MKALRQHLGQLLGIAQVSRDQVEYEGHVKRIFEQLNVRTRTEAVIRYLEK